MKSALLTIEDIENEYHVFKAAMSYEPGRKQFIKYLRRRGADQTVVYVTYSLNGIHYTQPKRSGSMRRDMQRLYVGGKV